jgi:hypothetical protein
MEMITPTGTIIPTNPPLPGTNKKKISMNKIGIIATLNRFVI